MEKDINHGEHSQVRALKKTGIAYHANKNFIFIFLFAILVLGSYAFPYIKGNSEKKEADIKENAEKFIKENLIQPGTELEITDFQKEGLLYRMTISVAAQSVVVYITEDGKKLFPQSIDLEGGIGNNVEKNQPIAEAAQKKDIPDVELFVMSYCPYGIQAQKGILPVIQKLGEKINFNVKFVDYTLHGKKEFDENLNQYCIQKEQPEKYEDYLACFVKDGNSEKCATSAKLNSAKVSSCIAQTDKQFKLSENFNEKAQTSPFNIQKELNDSYGVQGSPTLVVNGQILEAGRDSASLLKSVCSGFANQPEECNAALSSKNPTPGFGN